MFEKCSTIGLIDRKTTRNAYDSFYRFPLHFVLRNKKSIYYEEDREHHLSKNLLEDFPSFASLTPRPLCVACLPDFISSSLKPVQSGMDLHPDLIVPARQCHLWKIGGRKRHALQHCFVSHQTRLGLHPSSSAYALEIRNTLLGDLHIALPNWQGHNARAYGQSAVAPAINVAWIV
jgi:hypothetical protein